MDRIQLAESCYEQLIAEVKKRTNGRFDTRELVVWLRDDVCTLGEEYCRRPKFREYASWPLRNLVKGAATAERRLIDRIDVLLGKSANCLLSLAKRKKVQQTLFAAHNPIMVVVEETVEITSSSIQTEERKKEPIDILEIERRQVEQIAQRPWADLVCPADYFAPIGEWNLANTPTNMEANLQPKKRPSGEFVVWLNPELHAVGDFVTRCMMHRIRGICDLVGSLRHKVLAAAKKSGKRHAIQLEKEQKIWEELAAKIAELDVLCFTGRDASLRDSCVILTQSYAAFGRSPELEWLGSEAQTEPGVWALRHRMENQQDLHVLNRVAAALGDLRRLYDKNDPKENEIDEAIASGGLVVISNRGDRPAVHWEGRLLKVDWSHNRKGLELLDQLARKTLRGATVAPRDVFDENSLSALPTAIGRLKHLLPHSLGELIESDHGTKTYRLNLLPDRIFIY